MIATAKILMLALAVTGVAGTGIATGVIHLPLEKAIQVHRDHLGQNSTMPEQSIKGQQNALDHLVSNQERWILNNQNMTRSGDNDTAEPD